MNDNQDDTPDNDNSDEPPPKRQRAIRRLDWRLDPSISFSDWRIVIVDEDDTDAPPLGEYHVHKAVLAFGERASDYFARLFETDMVERQDQCSKILLSKTAAHAFPYLLDFMYQNEKMEDPVLYFSLYFLKDYFQVEGLDEHISEGIFDACKDYDTLIRLHQTALEMNIETANETIFTPMKKAFAHYTLSEDRKLILERAESSTIRLEFVLESVKHLDQELSKHRALHVDRDDPQFFHKYRSLLLYIDFIAARMKASTRFPLKRTQLEEAFGDTESGIWKIRCYRPGKAAYLSLAVLYLEGKHCEPQVSLSESQRAAIDRFHRLEAIHRRSIPLIMSDCAVAVTDGLISVLLSQIRGDIVAHLLNSDIRVLYSGHRQH